MSEEIKFVVGSGNIYADLGFDDPEFEINRAELAHRIADIITDRKLKQAHAADNMGIDQSEVSAILRGHLEGFSIERLMNLLTHLDQNVRITVEPKSESQATGRIEVVAAL